MSDQLVISQGSLKGTELKGKVAVVTGAGRGIGLETARALIWLGAKVVLAEIDKRTGRAAQDALNSASGPGSALFVHTDVGNLRSVQRLKASAVRAFGKVDIVINNAITVTVGAVQDVDIKKWDRGYAVNLRGPLLLAGCFLGDMIARHDGVVVFVSSSGAAPFMGCYEVFKTAQVELGTTLSGELEGSGVKAFTIGPGIARTEGAMQGIASIAPLYGKTVEEFIRMSENAMISAEAAGAGFAAAVARAESYSGQETSSYQALADIGISLTENRGVKKLDDKDQAEAQRLLDSITQTLEEQAQGWAGRVVFERQWVYRDFKKYCAMAPEQYLSLLKELQQAVAQRSELPEDLLKKLNIGVLAGYWKHQIELLQGYEKDKQKVAAHSALMNGWIAAIDGFAMLVNQK